MNFINNLLLTIVTGVFGAIDNVVCAFFDFLVIPRVTSHDVHIAKSLRKVVKAIEYGLFHNYFQRVNAAAILVIVVAIVA